MHFSHADVIWERHPELAAGVLTANGVHRDLDVAEAAGRYCARAAALLSAGSESDLPQIQAWRRTFAQMGLKPTQYRCAAEALLRRLRKEGSLPRLHPLLDLCNAMSAAHAIPIAAFDTRRIAEHLTVRPATGDERYLGFSGETERPEPGEVVFADAQGQAHARRWTHRQSALSAIRDDTTSVLIVAEALHATAAGDIAALTAALAEELARLGLQPTPPVRLSRPAPRYDFA